MNILMPFGSDTVPVDVPDNWINGRCFRSFRVEEAPDAMIAMVDALEEPVGIDSFPDLVSGKNNACVVVDTQFWPSLKSILPTFLETLEEQSGIAARNITILLTNNIWCPAPASFVTQHVDSALRDRYQVVLHDPNDTGACSEAGKVANDVTVRLNSTFVNSELKILLGAVRPDLMQGFTGGRSLVLPGLADAGTLRGFYGYEILKRPQIGYGILRDNPLHIMANQAVQAANVDFVISALLTAEGRIGDIISGDPGQSLMAGIGRIREKMTVTLKEPMDIVVTCGGGAPFDATLYDVLAAVSSTIPIIKDEATLVVCAEMPNGIGPDPLGEIMRKSQTPAGFEKRFASGEVFVPGQWVAERYFEFLRRHEIIMVGGEQMGEETIWELGMTPAHDIQEAVEVAMQGHGQRCKICALPDGPLSLPVFGSG